MRIEVICTGDEVLTGKIVNTNFSSITQKLEDVGLAVQWETTVGDDRGLRFAVDLVDQPLTGFDLLVVPGGIETRPLREDAAFLAWLRTAAETPLKVSVCTGSLLLGAAGWLKGKPATTHPWAAHSDGFQRVDHPSPHTPCGPP